MSYWQANKALAKLSYFFINRHSHPLKRQKQCQFYDKYAGFDYF
jgi:hypothetical protein